VPALIAANAVQVAGNHSGASRPPAVPTKFSYTQICVRAVFTAASVVMLVAFSIAIASRPQLELGQLWVLALIVLLIGLNDPLYMVRIKLGGSHGLYVFSAVVQIVFSGSLFLFWLVYADGLSSASRERPFVRFYLPKLMLVCTYVGIATTLFVVHGRLPDRLAHGVGGEDDVEQAALMVGLCASLVCVGIWLSLLVSQAVYRLGWKKVEYIYTEREKSFVGITVVRPPIRIKSARSLCLTALALVAQVFVLLSLCGHLYRAVHGRRGSWMQLQLPFLTLTNSYVALLAHAFWPADGDVVARESGGDAGEDSEDEACGEGGLL